MKIPLLNAHEQTPYPAYPKKTYLEEPINDV